MSKKLIKKTKTDVLELNANMRYAFVRPPGEGGGFECESKSALYRYVYKSALSFVCVFALLVSLLLQSFYVAYADEVDVTAGEVVATNEASMTENEVNQTSENLPEVESSTEIGNTVIDEVLDISISEDEQNSLFESQSEVVSISAGGEILSTDNATVTASTTESNTTVEEDVGNAVDEQVVENDQVSTPENSATDDLTSTSTTKAELATTTHESISVVENDDALTFSEEDCTKLADGSFYCKEIEENQLKDALFSARDQDGDLEIFLVREGKQAQITDNLVDDASPFFDESSGTIVWQRLIDDRFQIIDYNLKTGEEIQITDGSVNNMEPTRQGKYTVWQRWINNSWNIVLYDGVLEKEITNDSSHNISPHIQGSLLIWNKTSASGDKTIEMYNIDSGAYVTVNDPEGLAVDNPRMVLVYDSLHPNGDVVTKGFDIFTGEFIQLDTLPKPLPEIPDSETTTEVKALTQPKPEPKSSIQGEVPSIDPDDDNFIYDLNLSTTTVQTDDFEMTLDLSQSTSTEDIELPEIEEIPDLVIPPFAELDISSATSTGV